MEIRMGAIGKRKGTGPGVGLGSNASSAPTIGDTKLENRYSLLPFDFLLPFSRRVLCERPVFRL